MLLKARAIYVLLLIIAAALCATFILADPEGPDSITRGASTTKATQAGQQVEAQAGNVTPLTIHVNQKTNRWQGYYGNITGNITLQDASGNAMYNWEQSSPNGEIYVVNSSTIPVWNNVFCFNFTNNKSNGGTQVQSFNGTDLEGSLGMTADSSDGVDETFNRTYAGSFQIGSRTINGQSGCSLVTLNVNDAYQEIDFQETLLTDNSSIIYTSLLEQDTTGFQGAAVDFQLIVGENGDVAAPSNYFFYVEIS